MGTASRSSREALEEAFTRHRGELDRARDAAVTETLVAHGKLDQAFHNRHLLEEAAERVEHHILQVVVDILVR